MRLHQLTIRNFRNIAALDVEIPESGVVIVGENGQGKTNFLEAVYYLVLFRSFRGAKDRELIRFGQAGFFVGGAAGVRITAGYEAGAGAGRKKVTVDGTAVGRLGEAVGRVVAVAFSPTDREIVGGGPAGRRRYLDVLLSLSQPGYLEQLVAMRSALKQRNAALRRGRGDEARAFDPVLTAAAARVAEWRIGWTHRWARRMAEISAALGELGETRMWYHSHIDRDRPAEALAERLAEVLERDLRRGVTTVGPHRDDLRLAVNDRELRTYGSAGQQRTAAIALRLVEAETLADQTGEEPIALYDDVFAELDPSRQARLLELIQTRDAGQAVVAAPRDAEVPSALLARPRWTMAGGHLAS